MDTRHLFVGIWDTQAILRRQMDGCETAPQPRPALAPGPRSRRGGTDRVAGRIAHWWMRLWRRGAGRSLAPRPQR